MASLTVRPARPEDAAVLLELFGELAEYEHLEHEMKATEEQLRGALFGVRPAAEALIAERAPRPGVSGGAGGAGGADPGGGDLEGGDPVDGDPATEALGYALFFPTFSSFLAGTGVWLEDLFVREEHRGEGVGRALLEAVAARVEERGGGRLEWAALDWNEPALGFYRKIGARTMGEWVTHRLDGEALARVAAAGRR
ncbi:MAG: GNAT family N-acetyltransferase [Solirubrobacteraceae bacterium]